MQIELDEQYPGPRLQLCFALVMKRQEVQIRDQLTLISHRSHVTVTLSKTYSHLPQVLCHCNLIQNLLSSPTGLMSL